MRAGKWGLLFFQPVGIDWSGAGLFGPDGGLIWTVYKGRENNRIILAKVVDVYAMRCVNTGRKGISPTAKPHQTTMTTTATTATTATTYFPGDFLCGEFPTPGDWKAGIFTDAAGKTWRLAIEPDKIHWADGSPVDGSGPWPLIPA